MKTTFQKGASLATTIVLNALVTILLLYFLVPTLYPGLSRDTEPTNMELQTGAPVDESRIVEVVEQANPSVLSIVVTANVPVIERYYEEYNPFGGLFGDGFGFQVPRERQLGTEERQIGGGSGFIVSSDGLVVTNRHVVDRKDVEYTGIATDGSRYALEVVAIDSLFDVAVLQIQDARNLPALSFGNSDDLQLGQTVIAIGYALGEFENSVSVGVVSGLSRSIQAFGGLGQGEELDEVIQTDAAINPGNSGGPLLNTRGEVVGVNVAVATGVENIGFALPSNLVEHIVRSVEETGEIERAYLGVRYMEITDAVEEEFDLPVSTGVIVVGGGRPDEPAVAPGSPAERAGIRENDIILEVNGEPVGEGVSVAHIIRTHSPGEEIELLILRNGEELTVRATLSSAPEN